MKRVRFCSKDLARTASFPSSQQRRSYSKGPDKGSASAIEFEERELQPKHLDDSISEQDLENAAEGFDEAKADMGAANKSHEEGEKEAIEQIGEDEKQLMVVEGTDESSPCLTHSLERATVGEEVEAPIHEGGADGAAKHELDPTSSHRLSPEKEKVMNNCDLKLGLDVSNKAIQGEENAAKDKGMGVAVAVDELSPRENSLLITGDIIACRDGAMEGPRTRRFWLFSGFVSHDMSYGQASALNRSASFPMRLSEKLRHQDDPARSVGSHATRSDFGEDGKHGMGDESVSILFTSSSQRELDQGFVGGIDHVQQIICLIVSEPIHAMASRVRQLPQHSLVSLKEATREIIVKQDDKEKLSALQEVLCKRSDLDLETLYKSHRAQLEILVAVKTGLPEFLQHDYGFTSMDLAEIFLNLKCRNISCGRALPVDKCDCIFCSRKDGFCSECMCLVCSKFDTASKACDKVGCDACVHWCHMDCAFVRPYTKNGQSASSTLGVSEIRLYCLACEHPSEMFGFVENAEQIIRLIVSQPIQALARSVCELPERSVVSLKEITGEIIVKEDDRGKLHVLQEVLRKRSDLNLETLSKSHRTQLQILVAIKTGLPEFVQHDDGLTSRDLAEIFLNLKCRNIYCKKALPVDDCDCRFCSGKDGFCSECMCLVCSKFDTASSTCDWVGCDACIHWCHVDCALVKPYIRNSQSSSGALGVSEKHFCCPACEHPSEMFGFVKDVFKICAAEWEPKELLRQLEHVKKIFDGSNDARGRLLHDIAKLVVARLQLRANPVEVCNQIVRFLNGSPVRARSRSKALLKRVFLVLNVVVEVCQAVLSQEAAEHKMSHRIYLKLSIVASSVCLIMSLLDAYHQGRSSGAVWRRGGYFWWVYYPGFQGRLFGSFLLYFGIICSMVQLVVNLTATVTNREFIKFDYVPLLLSVCQLVAAMITSRENSSAMVNCAAHGLNPAEPMIVNGLEAYQCPNCPSGQSLIWQL